MNLLLDVGQGRSQAIMSYNQVLNYQEKAHQEDDSLYKFRAITNHHGPLKPSHPSYNGSLYNVMVEWDDRIPSTTPGAEPPRDAKDPGSARSHSTHLETSSSNRP